MKNFSKIEINFDWDPEEAPHVMPIAAALIQMAHHAASAPLQLPVDPLQQMQMQMPLMMAQLQLEAAKQNALLLGTSPQPGAHVAPPQRYR